jgi:histidinol dehydrogenase
MRVRRFEWERAGGTAAAIRSWTSKETAQVDVAPIEAAVREGGDVALLELTARFDATERAPDSLLVARDAIDSALAGLDPGVRESLEIAAANVRAVALAQVDGGADQVRLPQGQTVSVRTVPIRAAGLYAPGGRASYPSSVLMGAVPARAAGVERLSLATPPRPDGTIDPLVLAAAAICEIDDVYAIGGAQAIFALAYGSETVAPVDVVAGPGNAWVREAKRAVSGTVGIDSLAGPSELMLIAGHDTNPEWAALDLCAQAEHGGDGPLIATAVEEAVLAAVAAATERAVGERSGIGDAPLALVRVPDLTDAIDLANAFAPEHLELLEQDAALLADRVTTAGCVFAGRHSATAFGDYVAGSNHVLPTGGAGRFSGPLGPDVFRRKIATVEVPGHAAAKLAPHVDALARAEGFPVHGESAMIRR